MNTEQHRKILMRIQTLEKDISAAEKTYADALANGYQSATLTSGGGSKSFTRMSLKEMLDAINAMKNELSKLQKLLVRNGQQSLWSNILIVYS